MDSDRDGSHNKGTYTGTGGVGSGTGMAGGFGTHHGSTNYGPHDSNAANKLDRKFFYEIRMIYRLVMLTMEQ